MSSQVFIFKFTMASPVKIILHFLNKSQSEHVLQIHGHLINLRGIKLFNVSQNADIVVLDKVDGHAAASKSSAATNAVNVQLSRVWQIIVNDQSDLRYVDAASKPH